MPSKYDIMDLLYWTISGLIAGLVAKILHPRKDPGGWLVTILIGIAGALIGGWAGHMAGWGMPGSFSIRSFILAVAGAVLFLWLYGRVARKGDV